MSKLQKTIEKMHQYFAQYRFDLLANTLYEFVWHEYCDWYLELSKPVLYNNDSLPAMKRGTQRTLLHVLENILRLAHPIMPFITEEVWQKTAKLCGKTADSIMIEKYPEVKSCQINSDVESEIEWLKQVIQKIRTIRSEMNVPPSKPINVLLQNGQAKDQNLSEKFNILLKNLAKIETLSWLNADEIPPASATALVDTLEIHIPLADIINTEAEIDRLTKEIGKLEKDKVRSQGKLSNEKFVSKAPPAVINQEKERLDSATKSIDLLTEKLSQLQSL
jgi:valyl-tRNA synthetase